MGTKLRTTASSFKETDFNITPWIPLLQAIAEGKTIQVGLKCSEEYWERWTDWQTVTFDSPLGAYRVKPEPRTGSGRTTVLIDTRNGKIITADPNLINKNRYQKIPEYAEVDLSYDWTEKQPQSNL